MSASLRSPFLLNSASSPDFRNNITIQGTNTITVVSDHDPSSFFSTEHLQWMMFLGLDIIIWCGLLMIIIALLIAVFGPKVPTEPTGKYAETQGAIRDIREHM